MVEEEVNKLKDDVRRIRILINISIVVMIVIAWAPIVAK